MNMSYCKFRNTQLALQQCIDGWNGEEADPNDEWSEFEPLSESEQQAKTELIEMCRYILEQLDEE